MLELIKLNKCFQEVNALDSFSLTVPEGQTTVLIGPSGCGKSTVLRIIVGLVSAETGSVILNNTQVLPQELNNFRHKLGYVIQDGGLFPHLCAKDNIIIMARYLQWPKQKIDDRLDVLMKMFHLDEKMLQRFPMELSGGQQQRISLMRALMLDPVLLLLDEPLGALDPMIRFDLQQELKSIFSKLNKTVILVTHDITEAAFFADKIVLLRDGKIIQQGTLKELINNPVEEFVEKFLTAQKSHWSLFETGGANAL